MKKKEKKSTTLSEQFHKPTAKSSKEARSVPLAHKYMTAHLSGLVQALQFKKWRG